MVGYSISRIDCQRHICAPVPLPFGVPFRLEIVIPSMVWPSVWLQVVVVCPGRLALVSLKRQSRLPEPPWLPSVNQSRSKLFPPADAVPRPTARSIV
ncbi:hypothetical protein ACVMGC_001651 [Bradyrhizobium barranii subsp. barranii]